MSEKQRFAVALAGVVGCLCIAAGIVVTGPGDVIAAPVPGVPSARAERLPRVPMPSWSDVTAPRVSARRRSARRICARRGGSESARACPSRRHAGANRARRAPAIDAATPAAVVNRDRQATMPVPLMRPRAPTPTGADVVVAQDRTRERGPSPARSSQPARTSAEGSKPSAAH